MILKVLYYSYFFTMSDGGALFCVRTDAHAKIKAHMQELSIVKNDIGGYEYNATTTILKQINCLIGHQLFEESTYGMVVLGSESLNTLTE